jgi:hypothetical protein
MRRLRFGRWYINVPVEVPGRHDFEAGGRIDANG